MVIEFLKFRVIPQAREQFIQQDAVIWTPLLAAYPGFFNKEVWISPDADNEVVMIIRWETREQWKSIPIEVLEMTERQFSQAMGNTYEMVESKEYQIRKFPHEQ